MIAKILGWSAALWMSTSWIAMAAGTTIAAGKTMMFITPRIDSHTAREIAHQLHQIEGLKSIHVLTKDSSIRFIVKKKAEVSVSQIMAAIQAAAPRHSISDPVNGPIPANAAATGG